MTRKLDQIERDLVQKVKRGEIGRRDLFRVSAAGATALAVGGVALPCRPVRRAPTPVGRTTRT